MSVVKIVNVLFNLPRPPTIPTNNSILAIYSSNFRFLNLKVFMSKFSDRKAFLQCPFYCFIVGRWYQVIVPIYLITYKTVTQPFIATRYSAYDTTLYTQSTSNKRPRQNKGRYLTRNLKLFFT